ncbi:N-acetylmuramoyl-L-alanine amidase family protein [Thermobrachium celere]|uniref:N-acetylmuramoyl-L-alanine amidase family protein n=1 Tax=Thermobrachium celere TaxID=53422 RepID=UPI003BF95E65
MCIDPGHGGFDSGAVGPTLLMEKDVNLSISLKLAEILKLMELMSLNKRKG